MQKTHSYFLILCLLIFLLFWWMTPIGSHGDKSYFIDWSVFILEKGLANIYNSTTDYLPLFHYFLKVFTLFHDTPAEIADSIHHLKRFNLLFHFLSAIFVISLAKEKYQLRALLLIGFVYIINIASVYNSFVWAQVDEIYTCFLFGSFYFLYKRNVLPGLLFYVLAINFKLQSIVFLPFLGLVFLLAAKEKYSIQNMVSWIGGTLFLQIIILLPFLYSGTLTNVWKVIIESFGKYPYVSFQAYNLWELVLPSADLQTLSDQVNFGGLSYKRWGLLSFFLLSGFALWPLAMRAYEIYFTKKKSEFPLSNLLLIGALLPILFFYFNTQMHERYSHPAIPFLICYAFYSKNPWPALLFTLAYFLNLESILTRLNNLQEYNIFLFQPTFVSLVYLLLISYLLVLLYRNKK